MLSVKIRKQLGGGDASHAATIQASDAEDERATFMLDVEFAAPAGVTVLFGASGSGKSTTIKAIAGIIRPDEGRITIAGRVLFDSARGINLPIRKRQIGYVFQNLALFPHLSAQGNVEFALDALPRRERSERALALLESFHIGHVAARRPRHISGGEAQRVALARALASRPQLLLLDEPLSALDETTKLDIISDLKRLNRELQLPIIYVTHSREEVFTLGERVVVYEHGRVVAQGEPSEIFRAPVSASVARLTGVENLFAARVVRRDASAGVMTLEIEEDKEGAGRALVEVPLGAQREGESVRLAVRAGDILLATVEPRQTSARNVLRGRIESVEETGTHVRVRVRSGVAWVVSVTRQAALDLRLANETEVWLAFKSYSCHLLD